jgi:hypothetical protein
MIRRVLQVLGAIALIGLLAIGGCQLTNLKASQASDGSNSSKWSQVEQATPATAPSSQKVLAGSQFNKYFPASGGGYERVYTQEKSGFAEAKLQQNGKDLAMLAISDTAANPTAAAKYQNTTKKIDGYPAIEMGSTATSVLVSDRIQVKVLSRDASFSAQNRSEWIEKFDLAGLAKLVKS